MIKDVKADIFSVPTDALVHQCNCFHAMGSGIAGFIRQEFPEAYLADTQTKSGDPRKLGTFSFAKVVNPKYKHIKNIVNLYSQFDTSAAERVTRYDHFVDGLTALRDKMRSKANGQPRTITIPFRIGSNRGGGDWRIVRACIESVFADEDDFNVIICEPTNSEPLVNVKAK